MRRLIDTPPCIIQIRTCNNRSFFSVSSLDWKICDIVFNILFLFRRYPNTNTPAQLEALRRFGENGTDRSPGDVAFPFIEDVKAIIDKEDCINQKDKLLRRGGRRSFPSGHTSFAFAGATFCALYSYYWLGKLKTTMNLGRPGVNFPGASVKLGMFCLWYVPAIYVGISRTQVKI